MLYALQVLGTLECCVWSECFDACCCLREYIIQALADRFLIDLNAAPLFPNYPIHLWNLILS